MKLNKSELESSISSWEKKVEEKCLPTWEELPGIELYMDQVITLVDGYLANLGSHKAITQPMVNNYVKLGIMPAPIKKKYSKKHLAYLIIICFLKQTLSMELIKKIIPVDSSDEEIIEIYRSFTENQKKAYSYVMENVKKVAVPILETESNERMNDLVLQISITSNLCKLLTETVIPVEEAESDEKN